MKIEKVINNNVIVSLDARGREFIAMGRGLAFQRRPGDIVNEDDVEKVFTLGTREITSKFQQVVAEIPIEHILLAEKIIAYAKSAFGMALHDSIYVTLPDHISMALDRYREGIVLKNPMLMEIRNFYRDEYRVGERALEFLFEETNVRFKEDEAGFIAMHFVNSELDGELRTVYAMTSLIEEIVAIVREHLTGSCDEESISWFRFVTHVKFFAHRILNGTDGPDEDFDLYEIIREKYKSAFECAKKIAAFVSDKYRQTVGKEELTYLTIHINRLSTRQKGFSEHDE